MSGLLLEFEGLLLAQQIGAGYSATRHKHVVLLLEQKLRYAQDLRNTCLRLLDTLGSGTSAGDSDDADGRCTAVAVGRRWLRRTQKRTCWWHRRAFVLS